MTGDQMKEFEREIWLSHIHASVEDMQRAVSGMCVLHVLGKAELALFKGNKLDEIPSLHAELPWWHISNKCKPYMYLHYD